MDKNCHVEPIQKEVPDELLRKADLALLAVAGMGCENCAARVRNSLIALDGVYAADIFVNMGMAEVSFDGRKISAHMLLDAVSRAGGDGRHEYRAKLITIT